MNRTAVGFMLGYVLGFAGLYVFFLIAVWAHEGAELEAASLRRRRDDDPAP